MITPTVGRMVYYKAYGTLNGEFPAGVNRAACVTDVREVDVEGQNEGVGGGAFEVRLFIMNPTGCFFSDWLSQGDKPGQWDWMPFQKDQQARLAKDVPEANTN